MKKNRIMTVLVLLALAVGGTPAANGQPGKNSARGERHANVSLLSSVMSVEAGKPFDVALYFQIEQGWHIYWQNGGVAGLPPNAKWTLPDGFTAGEMQFPVPKRYVDAAKLTSNIHSGKPLLIIPITPPASVTEERVALTCKVKYLICKTKCIWEDADLRLDLPVAAPGDTAKAVYADLFERARNEQPRKESKYVSIQPTLSTRDLSPGKTFAFLVKINIADEYYLPARETRVSDLEKFDMFVERTPGIYFEDTTYPKPATHGHAQHGRISAYSGGITVRVPGEVDEPLAAGARFGGILVFQPCKDGGDCLEHEAVEFVLRLGKDGDDATGSQVGATETAGSEGVPTVSPTAPNAWGGFFDRPGLIGKLIACFLYGLFINATPCVLPLLSIKVLGFVQQAHESRGRTLALGLAFGAGVLVFFVILGFLAAAGTNVLQFPVVVIALGTVVMALALSMLGVYTLQAPAAATTLEASIQREGTLSSFGKGALAPVLGFACTGPLLAGAFGWATQQPAQVALLAFLFAGLGMASPYMLLGANPNWLSFLPKPGPWMITFERIMGFLLLAMVIWLLGPLVPQIGAGGLQWTLAFLVAVAMACWILGKVEMTMPSPVRWRYRTGALAIAVIAGVVIYGWIYPLGEAAAKMQAQRAAQYSTDADWSTGIPWRRWSEDVVEEIVRSGKMVFVDVTAAWCTVCKANKVIATNTQEVHDKLESLGVIPFQADFTSRDADIAALLKKHDRAGPPLNVIYPAGQPDSPLVLRPNLTKEYLLENISFAAALTPPKASQP
ncbi:MAG: thioredoxin family protein [Phycisphaerales bacterium]|nr:MAG: thioredoxin family protein [Phycisphaerales bacterium]